ncbi:3-isopropylmalate dehydratase small subunit [Candidatus Thorarchaeota archaeon]|nr:MAG: 3-isopropylmalate dehydratase small subunit [Candidatus Thorarchaeota archaeon]
MKSERITGKAWVFGDNIDTDQIIQGRYLTILDYSEMASHALETIRPEFSKKVEKGDILVAGKNLGAGSSREEAPMVLKKLGIACIISESFARIFYRNSFNIGLPALLVKGISSEVNDGDILSVDLVSGNVENKTSGKILSGSRIPERMLEYLQAGGAVAWYKKNY